MKERRPLLYVYVAILIHFILNAVDRFVVHIPDAVYIPISLVGIGLLILSLLCSKPKG